MAVHGKHRGVTALASFPPRRVVLLGASNVWLGLGDIVTQARHAWGSPLDVVAAMGFGRSYGIRSRVLARSLPGILSCGLWESLAQRPAVPTAVLLTDVGNDLLYGVAPSQIGEWVEQCLSRLVERSSSIVVTGLPLESLKKTGYWRFVLLRSLLFPECGLTLDEALERAEQLDERLRCLAQRYNAGWVAPLAGWYGFDPMHLQRRQRGRVWQDVFSRGNSTAASSPHSTSLRDAWRLRGLRPQQSWLFGLLRHQSQPGVILDDGSCVSWF